MTGERSHNFTHETDLADRYAAGRMPDAQRIAFENHFVTCAECQSNVRLASALYAAHSGTHSPQRAASASGRRVRWAGVAIAAGIGALLLLRAERASGITALGVVAEAPPYAGIAVRSGAGAGEALFDAAMREYAAAHYAAAATGLQKALAAGEDSIPTEFFIGASALLSGDSRIAADAFSVVAAKGDSPYADEAQLYHAKALLRLGRAHDALAVLAGRVPADAAVAARLSALADSVKLAGAR